VLQLEPIIASPNCLILLLLLQDLHLHNFQNYAKSYTNSILLIYLIKTRASLLKVM